MLGRVSLHGEEQAPNLTWHANTVHPCQTHLLQQEALEGQVSLRQAATHGKEQLQLAHEACGHGYDMQKLGQQQEH